MEGLSGRIDYTKVEPGALQAMFGLGKYLGQSGLEPALIDLINLRVSQINGCAYCIDMHWKDLRAEGESEQRLYGLDAWAESPYYSERERAALAWAEAVTDLADGHVSDAVFERVREQFSEAELVALTMGVVTINGWNRLNIAFRTSAGTYQPVPRNKPKAAGRSPQTEAGKSSQTEATH